MLNDDSITPVEAFNQIDYATACFLYIHQNPVLAGLVNRPEDWEFSSFKDYAGLRNGLIVNKEIAFQIVNMEPQEIVDQSMMYLDDVLLRKIY